MAASIDKEPSALPVSHIGLPFVLQKSEDPARSPITSPRAGISTQFRILLATGVGRRRARVAREHAQRGRDRFGEFSQSLG